MYSFTKNECYKGCVFTKKGFCKLSSRYQMDNKTCKLMKRSKYIPKSFKIPKKKMNQSHLHIRLK